MKKLLAGLLIVSLAANAALVLRAQSLMRSSTVTVNRPGRKAVVPSSP